MGKPFLNEKPHYPVSILDVLKLRSLLVPHLCHEDLDWSGIHHDAIAWQLVTVLRAFAFWTLRHGLCKTLAQAPLIARVSIYLLKLHYCKDFVEIYESATEFHQNIEQMYFCAIPRVRSVAAFFCPSLLAGARAQGCRSAVN